MDRVADLSTIITTNPLGSVALCEMFSTNDNFSDRTISNNLMLKRVYNRIQTDD